MNAVWNKELSQWQQIQLPNSKKPSSKDEDEQVEPA